MPLVISHQLEILILQTREERSREEMREREREKIEGERELCHL